MTVIRVFVNQEKDDKKDGNNEDDNKSKSKSKSKTERNKKKYKLFKVGTATSSTTTTTTQESSDDGEEEDDEEEGKIDDNEKSDNNSYSTPLGIEEIKSLKAEEEKLISLLRHEIFEKALNVTFYDKRITPKEMNLPGNKRREIRIVDDWAVCLIDKKSRFVKRDAKACVELINAVRNHVKNPALNGLILCHERKEHRDRKETPFTLGTQEYLLAKKIILASIPDEEEEEEEEHTDDEECEEEE